MNALAPIGRPLTPAEIDMMIALGEMLERSHAVPVSRDETALLIPQAFLDRFLDCLDAVDGGGDAEPELGSIDAAADQTGWGNSGTDDRQIDADFEDGADDEPSLGASNSSFGGDQSLWAADQPSRIVGLDLEEDHDGREPDEDSEPSLGSLDRSISQRGWGQSAINNSHDLELQAEQLPADYSPSGPVFDGDLVNGTGEALAHLSARYGGRSLYLTEVKPGALRRRLTSHW